MVACQRHPSAARRLKDAMLQSRKFSATGEILEASVPAGWRPAVCDCPVRSNDRASIEINRCILEGSRIFATRYPVDLSEPGVERRSFVPSRSGSIDCASSLPRGANLLCQHRRLLPGQKTVIRPALREGWRLLSGLAESSRHTSSTVQFSRAVCDFARTYSTETQMAVGDGDGDFFMP
jgi:hypothetical protein